MLNRGILTGPLLVTMLVTGAHAQQRMLAVNSTVSSPQKSGAEAVFANAASKIVFLITRKSGELHSTASGLILTADGYIATNYHALEGADAVEIRFFPDPADSQTYQSFNGAKLVYADAELDIAVLKVASKSLPYLGCPPKTVCEPRVGETVYAIGNPKGLTNTISEGIVSALRANGVENVIQHTAAISPGSSGGALVDSNGFLLGMNSWQAADAQNLNFAISAKHLQDALETARQVTTALGFPPEAPSKSAAATGDGTGQAASDLAAKDRAIGQMRQVVEAIRLCPGTAYPFPDFVSITVNSPPMILEWDVLVSDSLRAPFQGFVRFNVTSHLEETDEAKRSSDLDKKYRDLVLAWALGQGSASIEYRYEFSLGTGAPELRRALSKFPSPVTGPPVFKPYEPSPSGACWDKIASSAEPNH